MRDEYREALAASEARFRGLVERNADGVLVVRPDGRVCYANPAAEALLGRPAAELVGTPFGLPLAAGATAEVDLVPGASGRVAELRVAEAEWEGRPALLASLRDTTERTRAEAARRFLADAGAVLAGSLDPETTLQNVARLAEQHLADWCLLDVLEGDGRVRRLAADHGDPAREELARRLRGTYLPEGLPAALALALRE